MRITRVYVSFTQVKNTILADSRLCGIVLFAKTIVLLKTNLFVLFTQFFVCFRLLLYLCS
jgi:hypothetical protein